jgi:glutamyl-tRNA reductase
VNLVLVGLNHRTSPVEVRECLAPPPEQAPERLSHLHQVPGVRECFLLSTCNRVEALAATEDGGPQGAELVEWLTNGASLPAEVLTTAIYVHQGRDAVRHLFRVASSLDSLVLGEPQILGQIKDAYRTSAENSVSGAVLNRLLHKTFQVAKRVRSETRIGSEAISVSSAAVDLALKIFDTLEGRSALLVGAGEMAELAAEHLLGHGISQMLVANRTLERAEGLATRFRGRALDMLQVPESLSEVDIVITSTGATRPIITGELARRAVRRRRGRPLFFIDIAVPRDVAPDVAELDGCFVYDIDDLSQVAEAGRASRAAEAQRAELLVDQEVDTFMAWLKGLEVVPTISALTSKAEALRLAETERTLKDLSDLTPDQAEAIDRLTRALVKKMLHDPILFIKGGDHRSNLTHRDHMALIRRVFNLGDEK